MCTFNKEDQRSYIHPAQLEWHFTFFCIVRYLRDWKNSASKIECNCIMFTLCFFSLGVQWNKGKVRVELQVLKPSVSKFGMCSFSKTVFPCIIEEKPYNSCQWSTKDMIEESCQVLKVFFKQKLQHQLEDTLSTECDPHPSHSLSLT